MFQFINSRNKCNGLEAGHEGARGRDQSPDNSPGGGGDARDNDTRDEVSDVATWPLWGSGSMDWAPVDPCAGRAPPI